MKPKPRTWRHARQERAIEDSHAGHRWGQHSVRCVCRPQRVHAERVNGGGHLLALLHMHCSKNPRRKYSTAVVALQRRQHPRPARQWNFFLIREDLGPVEWRRCLAISSIPGWALGCAYLPARAVQVCAHGSNRSTCKQ
jgi:hypothetical protein